MDRQRLITLVEYWSWTSTYQEAAFSVNLFHVAQVHTRPHTSPLIMDRNYMYFGKICFLLSQPIFDKSCLSTPMAFSVISISKGIFACSCCSDQKYPQYICNVSGKEILNPHWTLIFLVKSTCFSVNNWRTIGVFEALIYESSVFD